MGGEGFLTLCAVFRVSPEPVGEPLLLSLLRRYRDALNYSIKRIHGYMEENGLKKTPGDGAVHGLLYEELKSRFGLPSRIAVDCYREAKAILKSWLGNGGDGRLPRARRPRMWLAEKQGYRVRDGYVEVIGGLRLKIIGWDRRYDQYPNRQAVLTYRSGKFLLRVAKKVPKPQPISPVDVLAVDVNEKYIVAGNHRVEYRFETAVERAVRYRELAERLQRKYSNGSYRAWLRRRGIRDRVRRFHEKARSIIEDWARKVSREIALTARRDGYAVAREDLTYLVESLRRLPRQHRTRLVLLGYRRFEYWLDWQCEKHGVPHIAVNPKDTSSTCPRCGSRLVESGYRRMKCPDCGFEADRDTVAVLNIRRKALARMGGSLATPTAPQMTDVPPEQMRGTSEPPKGNPRPLGRGGGQWATVSLNEGDHVAVFPFPLY
ncbi:RNA-guided endonuclease TnpB family protein [Desulfurococcus mucosus]|uniref:Transposase, IS605 OrfB family n=1 Tax=Desulfurococcus mucosus (strain ATCC 35584 / DSM 2162 / JCM 9187 / O7/1) TaxID=765177 RepID=E8R8E0_DESM0|nr:RNA-guided endonuclease TnpB family protein [Desulfurococcus mucosus]ADV64766.1 transposase, IS605 OrfB family [Desulfurococcus mucosus DSM 2162]